MKINNILEILKLEKVDPFTPCNGEAHEKNFSTEYETTLENISFKVYSAHYGNGDISFNTDKGLIVFWPATVNTGQNLLELEGIYLD